MNRRESMKRTLAAAAALAVGTPAKAKSLAPIATAMHSGRCVTYLPPGWSVHVLKGPLTPACSEPDPTS